ncbi:DUF6233 domain-containing protein [Streptomyces gardneri]|uniref:DUF6233 domain-containing protein n=1 Tax=Streptomyces gardneri TaxID=66892 RepID=UPI0033D8D73F
MEMPIAVRLEKKRTLLEWLRWQVTVTARDIRDLERQEVEERRRREIAHRELRWTVSESRAVEGHPVLHPGHCSLAAQYGGAQLLDRDGVIAAAETHPDLEMCDVCAPWGSLDIDKPAGRPLAGREGEFP